MIDPQTIIKSQVADDKFQVDLNEIVEKYGTVMPPYGDKTITLQIYNQVASDDNINAIYDDSDTIGYVFINGSITITKNSDGTVYIQGMIWNLSDNLLINHIEVPSESYENGILLTSYYAFDLYVIRI